MRAVRRRIDGCQVVKSERLPTIWVFARLSMVPRRIAGLFGAVALANGAVKFSHVLGI